MQRQTLKIIVAGQLLSGICREDSTRSALDREGELRNVLEIAEALIRLGEGSNSLTLEHTSPLLAPARPVQERTIEREPLQSLLDTRRNKAPHGPPRGPTLH